MEAVKMENINPIKSNETAVGEKKGKGFLIVIIVLVLVVAVLLYFVWERFSA
jgi:cytochrome c-type biogenesis protein CcmH/NrfG